MSLLLEAMTACTMVLPVETEDGLGGCVVTFKDGDSFSAAIVVKSHGQAKIADKQEASDVYTVITPKSTVLRFHDLFRRESDGRVFRVTSDGSDDKTPNSASLDMRQVGAEEFRMEIDNG